MKKYLKKEDLTEKALQKACDNNVTFGVDVADIVSLNIVYPGEFFTPGGNPHLEGYPSLGVTFDTKTGEDTFVLESCFGFGSGENQIKATRVWTRDEF